MQERPEDGSITNFPASSSFQASHHRHLRKGDCRDGIFHSSGGIDDKAGQEDAYYYHKIMFWEKNNMKNM